MSGPKYFFAFSLLAIALIVGYRYHQYIIDHNFPVIANVPCDPATESCFVMDCSPEEDPECDPTPYKKIGLLSREAPTCVEEHTCGYFSCADINSCAETFCSEEELEDGEVCYEPPAPVIEPVEEEAPEEPVTEPTIE